jgi:hypothetical protein
VITKEDWAQAEWLETYYINDWDKKVILRIQRYSELLAQYPDSDPTRARIEASIALLAKRLKVSESVANALSCFEVSL